MSEQAILSFRMGRRTVDTYVHDATGMPERLQDWMAKVRPETARAWGRALRSVDPDSIPTENDQVALMRWADIGVSSEALTDWYCLLRRTQGDADAILRAGVTVRCDPLTRPFARWQWVLDLGIVPGLEVWGRAPWSGIGLPCAFRRYVRLDWADVPEVAMGRLTQAVELLERAGREKARAEGPADFIAGTRRARLHYAIAGNLPTDQSESEAEAILAEYEERES